jgi:hypothetical protein
LTIWSAYDAARATAVALEDHALLESYYRQCGRRFAGLKNIVEFGLALTCGSRWLAEGTETLFLTDIAAPEVYAARDRLNVKPISNTKFSVLLDQGDIGSLPMCNLLYSVLSLRLYQAATLAHVLGLLVARVDKGGVVLLRAPTQHRLYQFMLPGADIAEELNIIPQWKIFEMLDVNGFSLILVQEDILLRSTDALYTTILAQRRS